MANEIVCIKALEILESGMSNDKDDTGRLSYCGISEANWPGWEGFPILKAHLGGMQRGDKLAVLEPYVTQFYLKEFCAPLRIADIINVQCATDLLQTCVLSGKTQGVKLSQRALGIPDTGEADDTFINEMNCQNPYA